MECKSMIQKFLETFQNKTKIMAFILSELMRCLGISSNEYMIIAGYSLKCVREITDIDVGVNKRGFEILKKEKIGSLQKAKISGHEKILIPLEKLGEGAEIEFFELEDRGFPISNYSLPNLLKENKLIKDEYGNNYFNLETTINFYSLVKKINNKFMVGDYEINLDRLNKNINHLQLLSDHLQTCQQNGSTAICQCLQYNNLDSTIKYLDSKLKYLKEMSSY